MTNARNMYKNFWEVFHDVLIENGEPFTFAKMQKNDGEASWIRINTKNSLNGDALDVSITGYGKKLRIDYYINSNALLKLLVDNKDFINKNIPLPLTWEPGKRGAKTFRVQCYVDIYEKNRDSYRETIETALPVIMQFIEVANQIGANTYLFDY